MNNTIIDILKAHHDKQGQNLAFSFLEEKKDTININYKDLYLKSCDVAHELQKHCQAGDRVVLLLSPGIDYIIAFLGCLMVGIIAVPCYPPVNQRFADSLAHIVNDCKPKILLVEKKLFLFIKFITLKMYFKKNKFIGYFINKLFKKKQIILDNAVIACKIIEIKSLYKKKSTVFHEITKFEDVAFLQYSSGTTGKPKGVMITNKNLIHNLHLISQILNVQKESIGYIWLPPYHDMGLIGGILNTLYNGFHTYFRSPFEFIKNPLIWLIDISNYKATISSGPNFSYSLCAEIPDEKIPKNLNLSSWETAVCAAETIHADVIRKFIKKFTLYGFNEAAFLPAYGLAEATLISTGELGELSKHIIYVDKYKLAENKIIEIDPQNINSLTMLTCGSKHTKQQLLIVNPENNQPLPDGNIGKIILQSESIAKGYWRQEDLSRKIFHNQIKGFVGEFLDTGDLGGIINEKLIITGRIKDVIIINGLNYHTSFIETEIAKCFLEIRTGCVALVQLDFIDASGVVLLIEVKKELKEKEFNILSNNIYFYILSENKIIVNNIYFLNKHSIPKTTSGKISRTSCIELIKTGTLNHIFHWNFESSKKNIIQNKKSLEHYKNISLKEIDIKIEKLIKYEIEKITSSKIKSNNILDNDIDSLSIVDLFSNIEKNIDYIVQLSPVIIYQYQTIKKLSAYLSKEILQYFNEEDINSKNYNLTSLPMLPMQWFYLNQVKVQKFNLARVLIINQEINSSDIKNAIENVLNSQPYMRCKAINRNNHIELEDNFINNIYYWQENISLEEDKDIFVKTLHDIGAQLCEKTNYLNGPLIALCYLHNKKTNIFYLIININHLCIDPASEYIFMRQLDEFIFYKNGSNNLKISIQNEINQLNENINKITEMVDNKLYCFSDYMNDCFYFLKNKSFHIDMNKQIDESKIIVTLPDKLFDITKRSDDKNSNFTDRLILSAIFKSYKDIYGIDTNVIQYLLDGHSRLNIKHTVTFSTLLFPVAVDLRNISQPKEYFEIITKSIEKQREYILKYNFLASSKSFDKSIFPFTAPYIEYNNFGIQKSFQGTVLSESNLFDFYYLEDTFDKNMPRYREIFIRPFIINKKIHIALLYAKKIYSHKTILKLSQSIVENIIEIEKNI